MTCPDALPHVGHFTALLHMLHMLHMLHTVTS